MRGSGIKIELADADSSEARACIDAYYRELQERFEAGFDPGMTVSANPEELTPPAGYFFLAWLDDVAVGCIALKVKADSGEIKRMWVAQNARGRGIAQQLLNAIEAVARQIGIKKLQLDTNRSLTEAKTLYLRNGYVEIPAYNDNPYADHWFEKRL